MTKNTKSLNALTALCLILGTSAMARAADEGDIALQQAVLPPDALALSKNSQGLKHSTHPTEEWQETGVRQANEALAVAGITAQTGHYITVVDRGPAQTLVVFYVSPNGWIPVLATHVSTGKPGRKEHFKTPLGAFTITGDILGYRALGTYNQNHIRGIGAATMRVWDFGWRQSVDWRTPKYMIPVRLEMHATDPDVLDQRIGRPDSEGCIRIPAPINRLLDQYGVLDQQTNARSQNGSRSWKALFGAKHQYLDTAGDTLIVIDESEKHPDFQAPSEKKNADPVVSSVEVSPTQASGSSVTVPDVTHTSQVRSQGLF